MKMKNKTTLLAVATLATLAIANNAKADTQDAPVASQEASELVSTTSVENNTTTPETVSESVTEAPTTITKEGTEITVTNPEVEVTYPNGQDKYKGFNVEYKNIKFDDSMDINPGDTVKFELPKEVTFQTKYEFDVTNPENQVVGNAVTDPDNRTVTTVFNDYFKSHPLNKQMGLKLDVKYTDEVKYGEVKKVSFNGTIRTITVAEDAGVGKDEVFAKWGKQDKDDASTINWVVRLNVSRKVLSNAVLEDRWSDNQSFVEGSEKIYTVDDVANWKGINDAKSYLTAWNVMDGGFDAKFKTFNKVLYIEYKTKLKQAIKESHNPTNSVKFNADEQEINYVAKVELVGGKGDASGESKPEPTWEIPNEAPKYEKPELNINDIPLMPPPPVVEIPELPLEDIPLLPPAPILDKPELPLEDIPLMPPPPVVEIPELHIPEEPVKPHEDPKTPPVTPEDKPKVPSESPKVEPKKENVEVKNTGSEESPKTYDAPAVLPATGTKLDVSWIALGVSFLTLAIVTKKKD